MEEENDWAVSNLGETDICVLGKYNTNKHIRFYRIKVPDPEACPPPSYFSSPLFKLMMPKSPVGSLLQSETLDDLVEPAR